MRATVEDHGAVQEELRSAHEEMLSANEEFQSANEELETSKEELQSTNEELTTTIDELRSRNQELATLNAELDRTRLASESRAYLCRHHHRDGARAAGGARRGAANSRVNSAFLASLDVPREQAEGRLLDEIGDGRWSVPELRRRLGALLTGAQPLEDWEVQVDGPVKAAGSSRSAREKSPATPSAATSSCSRSKTSRLARRRRRASSRAASGKISSSPRWDMSCDIR